MKVYYIKCKKCKKISPSPGYFYKKWKGIKDICIWCLGIEEKKHGISIH